MIYVFVSRRKAWKDLLVRADIDHIPVEKFQNRFLCSLHFDDCAYMCPSMRYEANASLRHDALPSLWPNHPAPPPAVKKRKPPTLRLIDGPSKTKKCKTAETPPLASANQSAGATENLKQKNKILLNQVWRLKKSLLRAKCTASEYNARRAQYF